ncbi:MAG: cell division protein FtsX [Fimbriimonadaceae bacterium]
MFDRLEFLLSEAVISLRRNKGMTFASIIASALALVIVGGFTLSYIGLAKYLALQGSKFEMSVFARDDASPDQVLALGKNIQKLPGVKTAILKTKAEVWSDWKKKNPDITSGLELDNPMPDTYTVTFTDLKQVDSVVALVKNMPEVAPKNGVNLLNEVQTFLQEIMASIKWLGLVLGLVTLATGGILIYNTVHLTMVARRRELRIMELVGASKSTVQVPLLIEGVTQGVLGSLLATLVLWLGHSVISKVMAGIAIVKTAPFPLASTMISLAFVGALYGFICSTLAIRENPKESIPR